jgi:hypothetical protein
MLLLPFGYWLGTRLRKLGERVQYAFAVLGPQLVWLLMLGQGFAPILPFLVGFAAMICSYEIGYIANDHWAQRRERAAGLAVRKVDPTPVAPLCLLAAVGLRVLAVAALLAILHHIWGSVAFWLGYLAALLAVFMLHNLALGRIRVATFFMLYGLRLALPLVAVYAALAPAVAWGVSWEAFWAWALYGTLFSAGFALTYGIKKDYLRAPLFLSRVGGIELPMLVAALTALLVALGVGLLGHSGLAGWITILALWHILYWVGWASLRFAIELRAGLRRACTVLSHCHTDYSHDGSITLAQYRAWLDADPARHVFLTDHAEDFDAATLASLKADYQALAPRVTVGLEFPVIRQHILAHDLQEYFDTRDLPAEQAMLGIRARSKVVIWAHPRFALRRLLRPAYVADLLTLLALSDGIEFFNPKNVRRKRYRIMMLGMAWLGCALYGRKLLYLGVDAHAQDDLPPPSSWQPKLSDESACA